MPDRPRRVLIVDDHQPTASGLARLIRVLGHEVQIAHDGPAALDGVESYQPDLVLLDIGLPHMDGYEVVRQMRARATLQNVTVVALTGYGADSDRERARQAGFDHHLVKPVNFQAIAALFEPPTLAPGPD
jgi:two-component system, OmpR family, response regulator